MIDPLVLTMLQQSVLDAACACLEQSGLGLPTSCFLSHNEPPDDCCDFLAVWIERIRPSHGFADGQYQTGGRLWAKCGDLSSIADINVRLVRPCYPVVSDDPTDPFPTAAEMQNAAEGLLQDAWILNCCLQSSISEAVDFVDDCLEIGIGDMAPHGPQGGCAGWTWDISIELPRCC